MKTFGTDHSYLLFLEAVVQRCSVKKVFLGISQNSQETTCVRGLRPATLLNRLNRLRFSCFPLNFAKFSKTPFLQNTFGGCFCVSLSELLIAAISNNNLMNFLQKLQEKGHCFNCLCF